MTAVSSAPLSVSASTNILDSTQEKLDADINTKKADEIKDACERHDVQKLIDLASSEGGLLTDELRRTAWPLLLGCNTNETAEAAAVASSSWKELDPHPDEEQVQKDVDRAFVYYPAGQSALSLRTKKLHLLQLIQHVLRTNRSLHYFQGYHDIAQVFLLVSGDNPALAAPLLTHLTLLRIRDYLLPTLAPATQHLHLILPILQLTDPPLAACVAPITPFFALSAILTLFAHDLTEYTPTTRLFDFLLAHPPIQSVYLFAALLTTRRAEFLAIPADEPDILLYTLSKLPPDLPLQTLITVSLELYRAHPPESLGRAWRQISSDSVLKTCRTITRPSQEQHTRAKSTASVDSNATLDLARAAFTRQTQRLARDAWRKQTLTRLKRHRGQVLWGVSAFLVVLLGSYIRRDGGDRLFWLWNQYRHWHWLGWKQSTGFPR